MGTISRISTYSQPAQPLNFLGHLADNYLNWADKLSFYRYMLIGILIIIQGNIIAPLNLILITHVNLGMDFIFVPLVTLTTMAVLVSNIAMIPMRYVMGIFIANLAINLAIAGIHFVHIF
ncbi:MAG TPA: hypothetical protein VF691_13165 [Cytophagaceae bacterium]